MSDPVLLALIAAVASTIGGIISLIGMFISAKNSGKLNAVTQNTDGMADKLASFAGKEGFRKGEVHGAAKEKARVYDAEHPE